jgi:hypothetical protein
MPGWYLDQVTTASFRVLSDSYIIISDALYSVDTENALLNNLGEIEEEE